MVLVVSLVCPEDFVVLAAPGSSNASVDWPEPDLTGWEGPPDLISTHERGTYAIGLYSVTYRRRFAEHDLSVDCSISFEVVGVFCRLLREKKTVVFTQSIHKVGLLKYAQKA